MRYLLRVGIVACFQQAVFDDGQFFGGKYGKYRGESQMQQEYCQVNGCVHHGCVQKENKLENGCVQEENKNTNIGQYEYSDYTAADDCR